MRDGARVAVTSQRHALARSIGGHVVRECGCPVVGRLGAGKEGFECGREGEGGGCALRNGNAGKVVRPRKGTSVGGRGASRSSRERGCWRVQVRRRACVGRSRNVVKNRRQNCGGCCASKGGERERERVGLGRRLRLTEGWEGRWRMRWQWRNMGSDAANVRQIGRGCRELKYHNKPEGASLSRGEGECKARLDP